MAFSRITSGSWSFETRVARPIVSVRLFPKVGEAELVVG
jgi:hypothetical protein